MSKLKSPLLSLEAKGTIGAAITYQGRGQDTIARTKPIPTNPYSLNQAYQRWDYKDLAFLWSLESESEKQDYRTRASRYHITGFQLFMREHLKNLPGIAVRLHLDYHSGSTLLDSSKNENTGTKIGCVYASGLIAQGLYFDGLNDHLVVPDDPSLDLTSPLTLECFANPDTTLNRAFLMKPWTASFRFVNYSFQINNSHKLQAGFGDGTNYKIKFTSDVVPSGWHHYCATISPGSNIGLFIDGVEWPGTYDGTATLLTKRAGDLSIGRYASWWYKGWLDEIRVSNYALRETEIYRHSQRRYSE